MPKRSLTPRIVRSAASVALIIFAVSVTLVLAQGEGIEPGETSDQPKERSTQVTATVADREAPSTPILISPADETKFTANTPTLVWKGSTDNFMVSHYQLIFNGSTKFATIPTTATDNANYQLTYDSQTEYYSLVFKSGLGDGSYAWRIVAVDIYDNKSSSVTWDFSIDTTAPSFVIKTIEDASYDISVQDNTNLPAAPIELKENQPKLTGTGESNSTVKLTLTFADGSTENSSFVIDSNGNWNVTLGTLPRDQVINLDFEITDPSGNKNFLSDIELILRTPVVSIPIPEIPGLIQPEEPALPAEEPTVIEIPILPPEEYIPPVVTDLTKSMVFYTRSYVATVREFYVSFLDILWMGLLIPLVLLLPLSKLSILSVYFRHYLTAQLFKDFIWIMGVTPDTKPQGIAVSSLTQEPLNQALVFYSGKDTQGKPVKLTRLTNSQGIYRHTILPQGEYRVSLQHSGHFFPVLQKAPQHLDRFSYYLGTPFKVKESGEHPFVVIPAEPVKNCSKSGLELARDVVMSMPALNLPLIALGVCVCLAYPSPVNLATLTAYSGLCIRKKLQRRKTVDLYVINTKGTEQKNVIIAAAPTQDAMPSEVTQTDQDGLAQLQMKPGQYSIEIIDFKQTLTEGDNRTVTKIFIDKSTKYLPFIVK